MSALLWKIALLVTMTHGFRELSRRFGPRWGGLALGLPCSTAIALIGVGHERGMADAVAMAGSCQLGLAGAVALPLAYSRAIGRGWGIAGATAAGVGAYGIVAAVAGRLDPSVGGAGLGISALAVLAAAQLVGRATGPIAGERRGRPSRGSARVAAFRTLVPVACLSASMAMARAFGPSGAGLMSAFPGLTLTVLGLTHLESGPGSAVRMTRALPIGNLGTVAFLAAFRLGGPRFGLGGGLALGYLIALAVLAVLAMPRRPPSPIWDRSPWPRSGRRFSPIFEALAA